MICDGIWDESRAHQPDRGVCSQSVERKERERVCVEDTELSWPPLVCLSIASIYCFSFSVMWGASARALLRLIFSLIIRYIVLVMNNQYERARKIWKCVYRWMPMDENVTPHGTAVCTHVHVIVWEPSKMRAQIVFTYWMWWCCCRSSSQPQPPAAAATSSSQRQLESRE